MAGGVAQRVVLLAGPEALALRAQIETYAAGLTKVGGDDDGLEIVTAESMLECVLLAGSHGEQQVPLIFAGVSEEVDQLESAVSSLRKVYAGARIVLLCEPADEVMCRKARAWGATDYLIVPVDVKSVQRLFVVPPVARGWLGSGAAGGREVVPDAGLSKPMVEMQANGHSATIASEPKGLRLPLSVQSLLFGEVLAARSDFVERAVRALQEHGSWQGTLSFVPTSVAGVEAGATLEETGIRTPVMVPGHPPFGTLVLTGSPDNASAELTEAAQWLGTLLSVGHRYEQLRTLAVTDELSGAYNRRYFNKFVIGLLERARASRFRVTLLLFDIDDFKKYNDSFGHASGDAIIRELIGLLRACTRPDDLVARLGGDEFAVVYWDNEARRQPNSEHPRDLLAATERFRKAIKSHAWPQKCNIQGQISISGGLATFPWDADSLDQLMAKADEALLRAKRAGKNVILLHQPEGIAALPDIGV